jgi:glutamine synthetase
MLVAAMDGVDRHLQPPKPLNEINVYHLDPKQRKIRGVKELPGSLEQALFELDKDEVIKSGFGAQAYEAFRRAKLEEWEDYRIHIMDWEVERYLETV